MEKELTNRKRQAIETRNKIYEIGVNLIKEKGYENVSIQDICQNANVSIGAFYHHFSSKENLITEFFLNERKIIFNEFFEEHGNESIKTQIKEYLLKDIDYFKYCGPSLTFYFMIQEIENKNTVLNAEHSSMKKILATIIKNGLKKNSFKDFFTFNDIETLIISLINSIKIGIAYNEFSNFEHHINMLFNYIMKDNEK